MEAMPGQAQSGQSEKPRRSGAKRLSPVRDLGSPWHRVRNETARKVGERESCSRHLQDALARPQAFCRPGFLSWWETRRIMLSSKWGAN